MSSKDDSTQYIMVVVVDEKSLSSLREWTHQSINQRELRKVYNPQIITFSNTN
jgi:hypothetical protein